MGDTIIKGNGKGHTVEDSKRKDERRNEVKRRGRNVLLTTLGTVLLEVLDSMRK